MVCLMSENDSLKHWKCNAETSYPVSVRLATKTLKMELLLDEKMQPAMDGNSTNRNEKFHWMIRSNLMVSS